MNVLSAKSLHLVRHKNAVLTDVSVALKAGEFVGLIGPNGAGKSSLMRILAGLLKPDQGSITLQQQNNAVDIARVSPQLRAQKIAYLAQNETPAWPLSVKNVVALGRLPWANHFLNPAASDAAITHALHITDLIALADRPITELSGGEMQRALLARVFAGKPEIILADEPIAALDVYHQLQIMELLQRHVEEGGSVVAALHDLSLAARYCTRLLLLNHGKIVADGAPAEVLTAANLAEVYGVDAYVDCRDEGVVIIPKHRIQPISS